MARLAVTLALVGFVFSASGEEDMTEGRFLPCPDTPNCVSSRASDSNRYIEPLGYRDDRDQAWRRLIGVVSGLSRTEVVENTGSYMHATVKSWLFRFVDDLEFEIDDREKLIHLRSASRVGYHDLGVNRRRCESIRERFSRSSD